MKLGTAHPFRTERTSALLAALGDDASARGTDDTQADLGPSGVRASLNATEGLAPPDARPDRPVEAGAGGGAPGHTNPGTTGNDTPPAGSATDGLATSDGAAPRQWRDGSDSPDTAAGPTPSAAGRDRGPGSIVAGTSGDVIAAPGMTIFGTSGPDTLFGGPDDDVIFGGAGADTLFAGAGNDTLEGGLGTDSVYGGNGNDVIRVLDGEFFDHAFGGTGTDTLDHSTVTRSGDTFDFDAGTITSAFAVGTPALSSIEIYLDGSGANTIVSSGTGPTYHGNGGDDEMDSEIGGETMYGGAGTDTINHLRINENYTFHMGTGLTNLAGELFQGFENTRTGAGNDSVTGTSGANTISGGPGHDTIDGGGGADWLIGGAGNDVLDGGPGVDTSIGNEGNDTFVIKGTNFGDNVLGGTGTDTLDLSGHTSASLGFVVNLDTGVYDFTTPAGPWTVSEVENVIGSARADTIIGGDLNVDHSLSGGGGNDSIVGGTSNDTLFGDARDDTLDGGLFADTSYGGSGADTFVIKGSDGPDHVFGGGGTDTLDLSGYTLGGFDVDLAIGQYDVAPAPIGPFTIDSVEVVIGSGQDDSIIGSSAANTLSGNGGGDTIEGGGATDTVFGGAGSDVIRVLAGQFFDHAFGGTGNDKLDHSAVTRSGDTFDFEAGTITSTFDTGTPSLSSIEIYLDGSGSNTIVSSGTGAIYHGNGGDDYMISEIGTETMYGGAGIDTIDHSRFGSNYSFNMNTGLTFFPGELFLEFENAIMGAGNDIVTGTSAANSIDGGAGNDQLSGGNGNDVLDGGPGTDTSFGGLGNDRFVVKGTNFGDHVFGGDRPDPCTTGRGGPTTASA